MAAVVGSELPLSRPPVTFSSPHYLDMDIDADGNLWLLRYHSFSEQIYKINAGGTIPTFCRIANDAQGLQWSEALGGILLNTVRHINSLVPQADNLCAAATETTFFNEAMRNGGRGDGGPAYAAEAFSIKDVLGDAAAQRIYVAGNVGIRAIDTSAAELRLGHVTTVVGTVDPPGDGPLESGVFATPDAMVFLDGEENMLIAEPLAGRVREVTTTEIRTVVGYPDARSADALLLAGNQVRYASELQTPADMAYSPERSEIFVVEQARHRIRRIGIPEGALGDSTQWTEEIYAGTDFPGVSDDTVALAAEFNEPMSAALDGNGILYVADAGNSAVRAIDLSDTMVSTPVGHLGAPGTRRLGRQARCRRLFPRAGGVGLLRRAIRRIALHCRPGCHVASSLRRCHRYDLHRRGVRSIGRRGRARGGLLRQRVRDRGAFGFALCRRPGFERSLGAVDL